MDDAVEECVQSLRRDLGPKKPYRRDKHQPSPPLDNTLPQNAPAASFAVAIEVAVTIHVESMLIKYISQANKLLNEYGAKHLLGDLHSWRFSILVFACISCSSSPLWQRYDLLTFLLKQQFSPLRVKVYMDRKLKTESMQNNIIIKFCMPNDFEPFWAVLEQALCHQGAMKTEHENLLGDISDSGVQSVDFFSHFKMLALMLHAMYKPFVSAEEVSDILKKYFDSTTAKKAQEWLELFLSYRLLGLPRHFKVNRKMWQMYDADTRHMMAIKLVHNPDLPRPGCSQREKSVHFCPESKRRRH